MTIACAKQLSCVSNAIGSQLHELVGCGRQAGAKSLVSTSAWAGESCAMEAMWEDQLKNTMNQLSEALAESDRQKKEIDYLRIKNQAPLRSCRQGRADVSIEG